MANLLCHLSSKINWIETIQLTAPLVCASISQSMAAMLQRHCLCHKHQATTLALIFSAGATATFVAAQLPYKAKTASTRQATAVLRRALMVETGGKGYNPSLRKIMKLLAILVHGTITVRHNCHQKIKTVKQWNAKLKTNSPLHTTIN